MSRLRSEWPIPKSWDQALPTLEEYFRRIAREINQATTYHPASLTATAGTLASGTVASLTVADDANVAHVDEVAATPGFDIRVNFNGVSFFNQVLWRIFYNGSATHIVLLQLYNVVTTAWDTFVQVPNATVLRWHIFDIHDCSRYVTSAGVVVARVYHESAGNPSHDLEIDVCWLR